MGPDAISFLLLKTSLPSLCQIMFKDSESKWNKVFCVPVGVSLSLHGSEPQRRSPHRRRVPLQPLASGYQAADRPLAFPTCGEAEIMEESSAEAPDSSTQDDVPPLGETHRHFFYLKLFKFNTGLWLREVSPVVVVDSLQLQMWNRVVHNVNILLGQCCVCSHAKLRCSVWMADMSTSRWDYPKLISF